MKKTLIVLLSLISVAASAGNGRIWMDATLSTGNLFLDNMETGRPGAYKQIDYAADFVLGCRAGSHFAVGAGASCVNALKSGTFSVPVFLRIRYDILDRFVSPYITMDIGWAFTVNKYSGYCRNGFSASIAAGASFRIENGNRMYLGVKAGESQVSRSSNIRNAVNYRDVPFFARFRPELRVCIGFEL